MNTEFSSKFRYRKMNLREQHRLLSGCIMYSVDLNYNREKFYLLSDCIELGKSFTSQYCELYGVEWRIKYDHGVPPQSFKMVPIHELIQEYPWSGNSPFYWKSDVIWR